MTAAFVVGLMLAQPAVAVGHARDQQQLAYSVRATYLVRFAAFVAWPPRAFASPAAPVTICVLGRNPFGRLLADAARGQTAHGRAIQVRTVSTTAQAAACHVLYVGDGGAAAAAALPASHPVLRVTDADLTSRPGMIHFVVSAGRVRFQVDNVAARRAGLTISARLLGIATSVEGAP